jgi:VCBS repeat protein
MGSTSRRLWLVLLALAPGSARAEPSIFSPRWTFPQHARFRLAVDPRGRARSSSPASVDLDFQEALSRLGMAGTFDESTIEVTACAASGEPRPFDATRPGVERYLLPHRLERFYGSSRSTLHFVLPDSSVASYAVYFDTAASGLGRPDRPPGLVGDGDFFSLTSGRREINASHFDQFADLDGDGDLDLFKGGVEPYVECFENVGGNLLVPRGRLTSGGKPFVLPHSDANRSWVTVAFEDIDGDGQLDFIPSFNDGPDAGLFIAYRNITRRSGGQLTFEQVGPLRTDAGTPVAGGAQAGGWFPSIAFVRDWDGDGGGRLDALVGSKNRCWLYRGLGRGPDGLPRLAEPVAVQAGGEDISLVNPRFTAADIDGDGDLDLLAGTQPGPVLLFRNIGRRPEPRLDRGEVVAFAGKYLIGDAHSGVQAADFDGDGRVDLVAGRFWERADLSGSIARRDPGGLYRNVGGPGAPRFEKSDRGSPHRAGFSPCDALRQNSVRAIDWDRDGRLDLLAGDTDGFVWLFRNMGHRLFPVFEEGVSLRAGGKPLEVSASGGHARFDAFDWNDDGEMDLVVADAGGGLSLFLGSGGLDLQPAKPVLAGGEPVRVGTRASVLAADFDGDRLTDLVVAFEKGYSFLRNSGTRGCPVFEKPKAIDFGGKQVKYNRPNLGSFEDWDGDGKRDLIACHFENDVRLYRNAGSGKPGDEPRFAGGDGQVILAASSPQMISGAHAVDWNGDGDLDLLTGQGHGGSGLRFFERDYLEDQLAGTSPIVTVTGIEAGAAPPSFLEVVRRYADTMIERGRDEHGPVKSHLFLSALDRFTLEPLTARPAPPGGIRRGDRPGRPWSAMNGANPHLDENLLRVLYTLSEITGQARCREAADEEIGWFFKNTLSPTTSLLPWGEHLSWDVVEDRAISGGDEAMHEFARPWVLWERSFALAPEECRRFALGLWEHQIANQKTGGYDRHAPYFEHGPVDGKDFPRHGGFYIGTWCHAFRRTGDPAFLAAIEAVLARFERKRVQKDGSLAATIGPLDCETAAAMVPEPLASRLRSFAAREDELILADLEKAPPGAGPPLWQAGYSASTLASTAMFCLARYQQVPKPAYRDQVVRIAGAYRGSIPEEDVDAWPMGFGHAISAQVAAFRFTGKDEYLEEALRLSRLAVEVFWQDQALPRASMKTGHYETITGADSLALALLEVHAVLDALPVKVPSNTIDR